LSLVVTAANVNDVTQLAALLDARVVSPLPDEKGKVPRQNLCADAGYVGQSAKRIIEEHKYTPHVRSRTDEKGDKQKNPTYRPRRWVVEVSHSWFTRFRKLLVRYEKTLASFVALHHLAAAIIAFRKVIPMYGPYGREGSII
jgi:IS5 family transposase